MQKQVGHQRLPESLSALLEHVQEQALTATSERVAARLVRLLRAISPRVTDDVDSPEVLGIDLNVVRPLCSDGVPDEVPALRATLWKVMLGYLPTDVFQWDAVLTASRASYAVFVKELWEELGAAGVSGGGSTPTCQVTSEGRADVGTLEEVFDQITKDIYRTRPEMDFFMRRLDGNSPSAPSGSAGDEDEEEPLDVREPRRHTDVMARVLLVYARLNPGVQYVQGMNELCAPLYYLFAQDPVSGGVEAWEADTFFTFSLLMSDMRDAFVKTLDHTTGGMMGQIDQFSDLLRAKDGEVWLHLDSLRVSPVFYSVRWLTLMLSQELEMPEVLRLWDSLLSDMAHPVDQRVASHPLLHYACVAMVILVRDVLLAGDFTVCMHTLQHYPPVPVETLLQAAVRLRAADRVPGGFSNLDIGKLPQDEARPGSPLAATLSRLQGAWRSASSGVTGGAAATSPASPGVSAAGGVATAVKGPIQMAAERWWQQHRR